jgi:uncharacterized protein (TIRG00374 family)
MLVGGLVFLAALAWRVNLSEVLATFARVSVPWTLAGFAVLVIPYVLRAWRFQVLLSVRLPLYDLFYVTVVHTFARDMLPLGLGEAFYPGFLKAQRGVPLVEAVGTLAVAHVLDLVTLGCFFVIAFSQIAAPVPQLAQAAGLVNLALAAGVVIGAVLWALRYPVMRTWERWTGPGGSLSDERWQAWLSRISRALAALQVITSTRTLLMAGMLSVLLWAITLVGTGIVYQAIGLDLDIAELALLVSAMHFFSVLPIHSVGGLGTLDSLWVVLIMAFGIQQSPALSYTILRRILSTAFSILMGTVGLFKLGLRPWSSHPPANSV